MLKAKEMDIEKMGQNAYERARRYDWDEIAVMTKDVYDRL